MSNNKKIDIIIAEYQTLRNEQLSRSSKQFHSITASITAVVVLLGFFIKNTEYYFPILLLIPWILVYFGIIWVDHSGAISFIGNFIAKEIENKKIPYLTNENPQNLLTRETFIHENRGHPKTTSIRIAIPIFYFILPSIIAISAFLYFSCQLNLSIICLIIIDSLLILLLIFYWIKALQK